MTMSRILGELQGANAGHIGHMVEDIVRKDAARVERDASGVLLPEVALWTLREVPTMDHFVAAFDAHGDHRKHPLLHAFFGHEARLGLVQGLADILAWHRLLFDVRVCVCVWLRGKGKHWDGRGKKKIKNVV